MSVDSNPGENPLSDTPESPTVKLRATLVIDYDARPDSYFTADPVEMAAIDQQGLEEDPAAVVDWGEATLTVEPVVDRGIHVETYDSGEWADRRVPTEYRWRVRHSNGEVMGSGEGYADARDRDHAVQVLFPGVPTKEVEG